MNRKKSKLLMLTLALTSVLMTAVIVNAKPLCGEIALNPGGLGPDIGYGLPVWSGTITGDISGKIFFYATGEKNVGQVHFFEEVWLITNDAWVMILRGTDTGVFGLANSKGRMNGVVTHANDYFEDLIGHNVHMSGTVTGGIPFCKMVFRVN